MTEFEKKLNETRDNRQKVSPKKNKANYSGYDNNLSDYDSKSKKPSNYRSQDGEDRLDKSEKSKYNAAKDDKSSDYDNSYDGGPESEDERNDSDTKQGQTPHKEREKYYGKTYSHDDLEKLTKDVDVSHEASERPQYAKTRKRYEAHQDITFESVLNENKSKLDEFFSSSYRGRGVYDDSQTFDGPGFYIVDTRTDELVAGPYTNDADAAMVQSQFDEQGGYLTVELDEEGERIY